MKREKNPDIDQFLTSEEFPVLHKLKNSVNEEEFLNELHNLHVKLSAAAEERKRCMRRSRRYDLKALCTLISGEDEEKMLLTNISETGLKAMLSDNTPLLITNRKRIQIRLRTLKGQERREVTVNARLIRISEPNNGYMDLCFDFEDLSDQTREEIKKFITVYSAKAV